MYSSRKTLIFLLLLVTIVSYACARPLQRERRIQAISRMSRPFPVPISMKPKPLYPKKNDEEIIAYEPVTPPFLKKPSKKAVIVIDAGHGGEDFGTHSLIAPKYQEKHLTLATANMLEKFLHELGYTTIMTRTSDVFMALDKRAVFANEKKPLLFISVHYNSAPSKQAEGVEVYFYKSEENKDRSTDSKALALSVLRYVIKETQAKSRGIKHGNFAVIRETNMPAILIEGGFLTNESEMLKLKDAAYLKKVAWGIALGVQHYLKEDKG